LTRHGFAVEALCGTVVDSDLVSAPEQLLTNLKLTVEASGGGSLLVGMDGVHTAMPPHLCTIVGDVPLTVHRRTTRRSRSTDPEETRDLLGLFETTVDRFRPHVLMTYGGDSITKEILVRARRRGIAVVFALHNFSYSRPDLFLHTDAVIVPSRFAADYYRAALGLDCTVLSNLVDPSRVRAESPEPTYATFVNPSPEKGVYPFVRMADELGRRRPDIPLLVVESRGTEGTLVSCGLDLRPHGNVSLMASTHDPREFWGVTRVCLLPSLWWENQPLVAIEAMLNGIPVIGSDRGGIPEVLGRAGVILPLPGRLTPDARLLPSSEEVEPWVQALIHLWDDPTHYAEHRSRALTETERWRPEIAEPPYVRFFEDVVPGAPPIGNIGRSQAADVSLTLTRRASDPWNRAGVWGGTASSWEEIPGFFDFQAAYSAAVRDATSHSIFVEVGTLVGRSTCYLASAIRDSGKEITLYAIDTCRGSPTDSTGQQIAPALGGTYAGILHRNILGCGLQDIIVPILTESIRASCLFPDAGVDFCFIDGDHSYESVTADLTAWWPKIKPGGIIAGHDYRQQAPWLVDLTRAVHDFFKVEDAAHPLVSSCWFVRKPADQV
jgi:glycosyltransferase involved in cell wall biosynthesis